MSRKARKKALKAIRLRAREEREQFKSRSLSPAGIRMAEMLSGRKSGVYGRLTIEDLDRIMGH